MKTELISIITPTYNRGYFIEKVIKSVIEQTYQNWEWFIVDDNSSDNTEEIVRKYRKMDSRIYYIGNLVNKGANSCRNQGVKLANGDYLAFLDSDNLWKPDKLRKQLGILKLSASEFDFVYAKEELINNGVVTIVPSKIYTPDELKEILLQKNVVDTNTVLIKKTCFDSVGGFDEKMPRLQDWELIFRLVVVSGYKGMCLNEVLDTNILQENSISKNDKKYIDAIFYILEKHNRYFREPAIISQKIVEVINTTRGEAKYILEKLEELYLDRPLLMKKIWEKIIVSVQKSQKNIDLLYAWNMKNKNRMYQKLENKNIAIYGLGKWGELLYNDMKKNLIPVVYGIDREVEEFHGLSIKKPMDSFQDIDVIIITLIDGACAIEKKIKKEYSGEVFVLEGLIMKEEL